MKYLNLKKGDVVYVRLPMNAKIIRVNKREGYTLRTDDGTEWAYFDDKEVTLVKVEKK